MSESSENDGVYVAGHRATSDSAVVTVVVRCYEELNDFLPPARRKSDNQLTFPGPVPVCHVVETLGVPHTEVELILVNGVSVGLEHPVGNGDRISAYPQFEAMDVTPLLRLRDKPLRDTRFVADAHLGRLARYLRMLGFDTLFRDDYSDDAIADIAARERRIVLSRDKRLLMRKAVTHGVFLRGLRPRDQLSEVLTRLDLVDCMRPFTRCTRCNFLLEAVSLGLVQAKLPPRIGRAHDRFWRCNGCQRLYWKGSHYQRMRLLIQQLVGQTADSR